MKYIVTGKIWPLGYLVEIKEQFDSYDKAVSYCEWVIKYRCGEDLIITMTV